MTTTEARAILQHAISRGHKWQVECVDCWALTTLDALFDQSAGGESRDYPFQIVPSWEMLLLLNPDAQKQWLALEVERLAASDAARRLIEEGS